MRIRSLGRQTDLIFAKFAGEIHDRDDCVIIKTPSNPGYHWGNYIIFNRAPQKDDYDHWRKFFNCEFPYYERPHHYVFTWDTETPQKGEIQEFIDNGFEFDSEMVLTTDLLSAPKFLNTKIEIRKISSDQEWNDIIELQILCSDPKYINRYYREFKVAQMKNYRLMSESHKGHWFGAYLDGKLVGDLGIYFEGPVARYQNVGTHPDFRRRGICGTLVYQAGLMALKEYKVSTLVMEADPDYHAARIYESVGFKQAEINYSLSWYLCTLYLGA